jgi:hypothetical protein
MHRFFFAILISLFLLPACTSTDKANEEQPPQEQQDTPPPTDEKASRPSPPKVFEDSIGGAYVRIDYSSPGVKGRKVWGELVKFGDVWRTGANEATVIMVDKPVLIEGQPLPAGRYGLFTIPQPDQWTIIINAEPDQWGAFEYDENQDVLRATVSPETVEQMAERLAFVRRDDGKVALAWDHLQVPFEISVQE